MTKQDLYRLVDELPERAVDEAARRLSELLEPTAPEEDEDALTPEEEAFVQALREELKQHGDILDPELRRKLEARPHAWLDVALASATDLGPGFDSTKPHEAAGRGVGWFRDEEDPVP